MSKAVSVYMHDEIVNAYMRGFLRAVNGQPLEPLTGALRPGSYAVGHKAGVLARKRAQQGAKKRAAKVMA